MNLQFNGKLPLVVLGTLIFQTATGVWWASNLSTTVGNQGKTIEKLEFKVDSLTSTKIVVLEAEVARLQAELVASRIRMERERNMRGERR